MRAAADRAGAAALRLDATLASAARIERTLDRLAGITAVEEGS